TSLGGDRRGGAELAHALSKASSRVSAAETRGGTQRRLSAHHARVCTRLKCASEIAHSTARCTEARHVEGSGTETDKGRVMNA
ncbi:MAG TPA: hypothetical protein PKA88_29640, partial [Polyangiaceae bacterium]|nr:hypothetical protein [Polyangiaceae bacterium]